MVPRKHSYSISANKMEESIDISKVLETFVSNRFDPAIDQSSSLPNIAGNYLVCLKSLSKLPAASIVPKINTFDGLDVIYTGIASKSLRTRDYKTHFQGNAGRSTLRKSLGVLFGYKLIPRDRDPTTGKTKFCDAHESILSKWMRENLVIYFLECSEYLKVEMALIERFNPPLNLQGCNSRVNQAFRKLLSSLRSSMVK